MMSEFDTSKLNLSSKVEYESLDKKALFLIETFAADFELIFFSNLDDDQIEIFKATGPYAVWARNASKYGAHRFMELAAERFVKPENHDKFCELIGKNNINLKLKNRKPYLFDVEFDFGDHCEFYEFKCLKDDSDPEVNRVIIGCHSVDSIRRKQLEDSSEIRVFSTLASEYKIILHADFKTGMVKFYNAGENDISFEKDTFRFDDARDFIVKNFISEQSKEDIINILNKEYIKNYLLEKDFIRKDFINNNGEYCSVKVVKFDIDEFIIGFSIRNEEVYQRFLYNSIIDEYESIYLANIDEDSFKTIKKSTITNSDSKTTSYSQALKNFAKSLHPDYRAEVLRMASPRYIQSTMSRVDHKEIVYRLSTGANPWRRGVWQVIRRRNSFPVEILVTFMEIDISRGKELELANQLKIANEQLIQKQKDLEEAIGEVENANLAKTDFLSRMNAELLKPLGSIIEYSEIIDRHLDEKDYVLDINSKIRESSKLLYSLINDVIDLGRIESGYLAQSKIKFDIKKLIDTSISKSRNAIGLQNIKINSTYNDVKNYEVFGDEIHVRQIFESVLTNAINLCDDGNDINIIVEENNTGIKTANYTIKITEARALNININHLFDSFIDNDSSYAKSGLSIVKKFAELLGGDIEVDSNCKTLTFIISLPLILSIEDDVIKPINNNISGLKILLADDNDLTRTSIVELLVDEGAIVTEAHDGLEAFDIFSQSDVGFFDVILMDIMMPVMDGLESTDKIRNLNRPDAKSTPIIAISANSYENNIDTELALGMNGHLTKPIVVSDLTKILFKTMKNEYTSMQERLTAAMDMATMDSLTGIKNKTAYTQLEAELNRKIANGEAPEFCIAECDANWLKETNDLYGHDMGDQLLKNVCHIICETFKHSPVFRVGGDEFIVVISNADYEKRHDLIESIRNNPKNCKSFEEIKDGNVSFAVGASTFRNGVDNKVIETFKRADIDMYKDKHRIKTK